MSRRELRENRENSIIEKSIQLLSAQGFVGMRMSDVAKASGYSMGTIYSHFESKEDLLLACAYTLCLDEKSLFLEISSLPIPDVEKIITVAQCSWLISMQHPALIEIDSLSLMPSVWRRATEYRAERLNRLHVELAQTFLGIVVKAIEHDMNGYVKLDEAGREKLALHLTHGMWGLCVGLSSTAQSGYASTLCPESGDESYVHFTTNYINFLRGYGWKEANPEAVFERCIDVANRSIGNTTWYATNDKSRTAA